MGIVRVSAAKLKALIMKLPNEGLVPMVHTFPPLIHHTPSTHETDSNNKLLFDVCLNMATCNCES